jgi:hypothetical protein
MDRRDWLKGFGAAGATALLLSIIMLPAVQAGLLPFPRPLAIAFADTLFDGAPAAAGLLLHLVYVTAWGIVYVLLFRDRFTFSSALVLGLVLWLLALVFFFPMVGWGLFGFAVGPHLITASLIPHLLFAILLWFFCRLFFKKA